MNTNHRAKTASTSRNRKEASCGSRRVHSLRSLSLLFALKQTSRVVSAKYSTAQHISCGSRKCSGKTPRLFLPQDAVAWMERGRRWRTSENVIILLHFRMNNRLSRWSCCLLSKTNPNLFTLTVKSHSFQRGWGQIEPHDQGAARGPGGRQWFVCVCSSNRGLFRSSHPQTQCPVVSTHLKTVTCFHPHPLCVYTQSA